MGIKDRFRSGQERLFRRLLKFGPIRSWYARRLVAFIDRSKRKRRSLPGDLARIDQMTRSVPKAERAKSVAKLLEPMDESSFGREMKRAAARQGRGRGKGSSGRRPGLPPNARAPQPRRGR